MKLCKCLAILLIFIILDASSKRLKISNKKLTKEEEIGLKKYGAIGEYLKNPDHCLLIPGEGPRNYNQNSDGISYYQLINWFYSITKYYDEKRDIQEIYDSLIHSPFRRYFNEDGKISVLGVSMISYFLDVERGIEVLNKYGQSLENKMEEICKVIQDEKGGQYKTISEELKELKEKYNFSEEELEKLNDKSYFNSYNEYADFYLLYQTRASDYYDRKIQEKEKELSALYPPLKQSSVAQLKKLEKKYGKPTENIIREELQIQEDRIEKSEKEKRKIESQTKQTEDRFGNLEKEKGKNENKIKKTKESLKEKKNKNGNKKKEIPYNIKVKKDQILRKIKETKDYIEKTENDLYKREEELKKFNPIKDENVISIKEKIINNCKEAIERNKKYLSEYEKKLSEINEKIKKLS